MWLAPPMSATSTCRAKRSSLSITRGSRTVRYEHSDAGSFGPPVSAINWQGLRGTAARASHLSSAGSGEAVLTCPGSVANGLRSSEVTVRAPHTSAPDMTYIGADRPCPGGVSIGKTDRYSSVPCCPGCAGAISWLHETRLCLRQARMIAVRPPIDPAAAKRGETLVRLDYELPGAHSDTKHVVRGRGTELACTAHMDYLRNLRRRGRRVLHEPTGAPAGEETTT
jgi:hypothetical protein